MRIRRPRGLIRRTCSQARRSLAQDLGEFILPYEAMRTADAPDQVLLAFLQSTYVAAADLGNWDRAALECPLGEPGVVFQKFVMAEIQTENRPDC